MPARSARAPTHSGLVTSDLLRRLSTNLHCSRTVKTEQFKNAGERYCIRGRRHRRRLELRTQAADLHGLCCPSHRRSRSRNLASFDGRLPGLRTQAGSDDGRIPGPKVLMEKPIRPARRRHHQQTQVSLQARAARGQGWCAQADGGRLRGIQRDRSDATPDERPRHLLQPLPHLDAAPDRCSGRYEPETGGIKGFSGASIAPLSQGDAPGHPPLPRLRPQICP